MLLPAGDFPDGWRIEGEPPYRKEVRTGRLPVGCHGFRTDSGRRLPQGTISNRFMVILPDLHVGFHKTEVDFRSWRSDNKSAGGIAAHTCAVATRNQVLMTAKALEKGAASGRIRLIRLLTRRLSLTEVPLQRTISHPPCSDIGPGYSS